MWQNLPWASGKLSQEDYETRRNVCTDYSVRSLASDPAFLSWLDSKRQDLQTRKQQARRRRRGWLAVLFTLALLAASGAFMHHRHGLGNLQLPTIGHLSRSSISNASPLRPARYLRSVSDLAQPLLDHAKPGPYLAAANSRLLPVYQQVAARLSAGIIQLPSFAPHSTQHGPGASLAHSLTQPPQAKPTPGSTFPQAAAPTSASLEAASESEASAEKGLVLAGPTLLQRMGRLSPVRSIAKVPGCAAKSLQSISKHVLLALPSGSSSPEIQVPASMIAQSDATGKPGPDGQEDGMPMSAGDGQAIADESSPGLLHRVNRSSTSLAVYIARMPMRTAKTWGHITKQTLLALPAANYLSLYKPSADVPSANETQAPKSMTSPLTGSPPSVGKLAIEESARAEPAAETTLLGRFNRSSKPLAKLIARLPARTSQGLRALSKQTMLALPAAEPATNNSAQGKAGAARPATIDAAPSETQEAAVASGEQFSNETVGIQTGSLALGDAELRLEPSAADSCSADKALAAESTMAAPDHAWKIASWTILFVTLFSAAVLVAVAIAEFIQRKEISAAAVSAACPQVQVQAHKRTQQAACPTKQPKSAPRKRSRTDPSPKGVDKMPDHLGEPRPDPTHAAASGQPAANMAQTLSNNPVLGQVTAASCKPGSTPSLAPSIAASCPAMISLRPVPCTSVAAAQQPSSSVQDPAQVLELPIFIAPAQVQADDSSQAAIDAFEAPCDAPVLKTAGDCLGALLTERALLDAPPDTSASSSASSSSSSGESSEDGSSAQIIALAADRPQHDAASYASEDTSEGDLEAVLQGTAVPMCESEASSADDAGSHTSEVDGFVVV